MREGFLLLYEAARAAATFIWQAVFEMSFLS